MKDKGSFSTGYYIANAALILSGFWVTWCIFYLNAGYREEILDQYLRSPELDYAFGAALRLLMALSLPIVALVLALFVRKKEKTERTGRLFFSSCIGFVGVTALYLTRPSMRSEIETRMLKEMRRQNE